MSKYTSIGGSGLRKESLENRLYFVVAIILIIFFLAYISNNKEKYRVIDSKVYYLFVGESFEKGYKDDDIGILVRDYWCYDGINGGRVFLEADRIEIGGVNTLSEIKEKLSQSNPKALQLRPFTIVSKKILSQWKKEGYKPVHEYYDKSPKGLTYEELLESRN